MRTALSIVAVAALLCGSSASPQLPPNFERAYELRADEGVFAYSRISPDGRYLTYASQEKRPSGQGFAQTTAVVVDLATRRVLFSELGMDGYFSPDGERMIYLSQERTGDGVAMWHRRGGNVSRNIAPHGLGDYYSWAQRGGRDLILTIRGRYYYLDGDTAVMPAGTVPTCAGIGPPDRPLISKDGRRISTFSRGTVVIRNLTDCNDVLETGIRGAKTDFSFDGRYVAMHAPRARGNGYDILVVDTQRRTVRNITASLRGNSYFPNWTRDGRLSFRYDGPEYRGFMFAKHPLSAPTVTLAAVPAKLPAVRSWAQIFPETPRPAHAYNLVLVYGTWSAHTPIALQALQQAHAELRTAGVDIGMVTATDAGSREQDIAQLATDYGIHVQRIPLDPERAALTEVVNQSPALLLFHDGVLADRRLGAQTTAELLEWIRGQQ